MRPIRSPTLLPIRMKAAETSASSAIADCTPLTVVSRSRTTALIDTFISDVSTTSTNMAIASRTASLVLTGDRVGCVVSLVAHRCTASSPHSRVRPRPSYSGQRGAQPPEPGWGAATRAGLMSCEHL